MNINMKDCEFTDTVVELDNTAFDGCTFTRCVLVYRGGLTSFTGCTFREPRFQFRDAAGNTLAFLSAIYESGGGAFIDQVIESIRRNPGNWEFGAKPSDN